MSDNHNVMFAGGQLHRNQGTAYAYSNKPDVDGDPAEDGRPDQYYRLTVIKNPSASQTNETVEYYMKRQGSSSLDATDNEVECGFPLAKASEIVSSYVDLEGYEAVLSDDEGTIIAGEITETKGATTNTITIRNDGLLSQAPLNHAIP